MCQQIVYYYSVLCHKNNSNMTDSVKRHNGVEILENITLPREYYKIAY